MNAEGDVAISLSPESKKQCVESIKRYFRENMDEDVGELKAALLLDYFLGEIAPTVYNQAIADAQKFFQEKTVDLDGSCFEPEFGYWTQKK